MNSFQKTLHILMLRIHVQIVYQPYTFSALLYILSCFLIRGWFDSCELRQFFYIERLRAIWLWEELCLLLCEWVYNANFGVVIQLPLLISVCIYCQSE